MAVIERTCTFNIEMNDYAGQDTRDMFGRRVVADYIVEWTPDDAELDQMDEYDLRPPNWAKMGELALESVEPKHHKKRYDFFLEHHFEDQGLDDPLFYVTLAVIDRKAA